MEKVISEGHTEEISGSATGLTGIEVVQRTDSFQEFSKEMTKVAVAQDQVQKQGQYRLH